MYFSLIDKITSLVPGEKIVATKDLDGIAGSYVEFTASANAAYYVRLSVADTKGLDYPAYNVKAVAYASQGGLGILTVNTPGCPAATWSLGSESVKYPGGSSVLVSGTQTVKLSSVTGYKAEKTSVSALVTVTPAFFAARQAASKTAR